MDLVKALLVFLMLTGCAEVAKELPLVRGATAPDSAQAGASAPNMARLGPPSPGRANARHIDPAGARVN